MMNNRSKYAVHCIKLCCSIYIFLRINVRIKEYSLTDGVEVLERQKQVFIKNGEEVPSDLEKALINSFAIKLL
jgi:hypothetical protein